MILLSGAFLLFVTFTGFFNLPHKITAPVTVQPWPGLVHAKFLGNIFMIQLEPCINEETRKAGADQRNKQAYRN